MHRTSSLLKRMALGAAGGLAGTLAIQALLKAQQKWLPDSVPPFRREPGEFMVENAEDALPESVRRSIPETVESGAAQMLGLGYGLAFGALYGALRPAGGSPLRDGLILGMVNWTMGYMGWLPALGLMPPVWRQKPAQVVTPAAEHVVYGMATVAAYDWLHERV